MASGTKRKTTMAKLNRERKLRERRLDKQARKVARKQAATDHPGQPGDELNGDLGQSGGPGDGQPDLEPVEQTVRDV